MAGIYIHIPYCRKACHYCDFHFSTILRNRNEMIDSISKEILLRKSEMENITIKTIYFGGGTPSLLTHYEINKLLAKIKDVCSIENEIEFTIEANPDDLNESKLEELLKLGVNRLSVGIQTFDDNILKFLNRTHNSKQALESIKNAQKIGFKNISTDLISCIPNNSIENFKIDIEKLISLDIQHISVYNLTIEEKTVLGNWYKKGKFQKLDEKLEVLYFEMVDNLLTKGGFEHYEVSNFAKNNFQSKHNSNYWKGLPYFGFGPSAHSFDGNNKRSFNIKNNQLYINHLKKDKLAFDYEILTPPQQLNEYLMVNLRTNFGLDLEFITKKYSIDLLKVKNKEIDYLTKNKYLTIRENKIFSTKKGYLFSDEIALQLFF